MRTGALARGLVLAGIFVSLAAVGCRSTGSGTDTAGGAGVTGSEFDVQFDDLKKPYAFGVAVFDNAQVRHAFTGGVVKLVFE